MSQANERYFEHIRKQPWYDPNFKRIPKPEGWEPELTFGEGHRHEGLSRCQQWTSKGKQCGKLPMKNEVKCQSHCGNKTRGIQHGNYTTGRHIKSVAGNPDLAQAYDIALKQKGLLNLSPNIALTDARLDLLYQDDIYFSAEIVELASKVYEAWLELKPLISATNPSLIEKKTVFNANFEILFKAMLDKRAFEKREDTLTERRRKLTETESKRQKDMAEVILKAEAIGIFAQMGTNFRDLILEVVEDKQQQTKVIKGFSEIIDTNIVNFFNTDEDKE